MANNEQTRVPQLRRCGPHGKEWGYVPGTNCVLQTVRPHRHAKNGQYTVGAPRLLIMAEPLPPLEARAYGKYFDDDDEMLAELPEALVSRIRRFNTAKRNRPTRVGIFGDGEPANGFSTDGFPVSLVNEGRALVTEIDQVLRGEAI